MIEVNGLTKKYGNNYAVDHISFSINDGEIVGFLGPNGAGKSTTMNMLTGYLSATEGEVKINGFDILRNPLAAKKEIGYLPEMPPLYVDMTVEDYLNFVFDLKKCRQKREEHISSICRLVRIENVYTRLIRNLSKGYRQRVGIAQSLIGNPKVLILDEPTVGLDPKQIIEIRELIKKLGERRTVILSSHVLSEVQAVCDRILVISQGKIVADNTAYNLSSDINLDNKITVRIEGNEDELFKILSKIPGVVSVNRMGQKEKGAYEFSVEAKKGSDPRRDIFSRMADRNYTILMMKNNEMSLEDIFLHLTEGAAEN